MRNAKCQTLTPTTFYLNTKLRRDDEFRGLFTEDEYRDVHGYFAAHPELAPTPLKRLRSIARELGIAELYAKDETGRFGINAFKIVGVSYAIHRLGDDAATRGLVCATAGNHGRAVARVAHRKHVRSTIFVPAIRSSDPIEIATRQARVDAMRADGATVVDVDGTYEDAVREAAAFGERTGGTIVSDTSWPGYEEIPRFIMAGYTHILEEASSQWDPPPLLGAPATQAPSLVIVQGGVGGLVCAAASWFAHRFGKDRPYFVAAEPENAACLMMSAQAGYPITIDSSLDTIMAGLRCAEPSPAAWPAVAAGVDAFVAIPDAAALDAMKMMSAAPVEERIDAGPSGACGLAALVSIARKAEFQAVRSAAGWTDSTRALVIVTEGR